MTGTIVTSVTLAGYRVTERIYDGSRTQVYRGIRHSDRKPVIIKLLKSQYPTLAELVQFRNQYAITKNLDLPGIVQSYSLENYRNGLALVMEDFGGVSLKDYATDIKAPNGKSDRLNAEDADAPLQPLPLASFLEIAIAIAKILEALYRHRVIHKDIKPHNILINPQTGQIKLIDFSISSLLPRETQVLQNPNVLEGTLAYMSPEQTGRMNRGIDYRTDFYSLGVTFYELLTGVLPFASTDPLELVYCHIAKEPTPPIEVNPAIPPVVNDIIRKLMAKTAEDRYQSAFGLRHDLEICLEQYLANGSITAFPLAARDLSDRFIIPEKLYGREAEVATLLEAFDRVAGGTTELMLVAGFSGIGKTAVINEVHKPIVQQRGYFIAGKFDQFKRDIPFSALVQALQNLMRQLLTEGDAEVEEWKALILSALGENGSVIIDVLPELERIIGKQPPVPELEGSAGQNRFNLLFEKFIRVFATKEHPLVIFLDDLQWADSASLKLMQLLMSQTDTRYLLLIGAYRDNEVSPTHPLMLTLDEISKESATVRQITLAPLDQFSLNRLIADTLSCPLQRAELLTELVLKKTKGNPFFTNQFLKSLHEEGLISFDFSSGYWQCDIARVRTMAVSDDVVEFMAIQLQKLPVNTQIVLQMAACIGNQFDLATLAIVCEKSQAETASDLWKALQDGLVIPISEVYKFFQDSESGEGATSSELFVSYRFLHDRVQQAAYFLIPESQKQLTHLKIGRLLLSKGGYGGSAPTEAEREEKIFDIVNQLNIAVGLITEKAEREQVAQLNLIAGHKAKNSTAYAAAAGYLYVGLGLLADSSWIESYDLTLNLYSEAVEAEYLNTNFERSHLLAQVVLERAQTLLDKVRVYEAQIQSYMSQNQMKAALDTGLQVLEMFGVPLERELPTHMDLDELANKPEINDPHIYAALRIINSITSASFLSEPEIYVPIMITMADICYQYGNSLLSAYTYAATSALICHITGDLEYGYRLGQASLKVLEKFPAGKFYGRYAMVYNACIRHWKEHARSSIDPLLEAVKSALQTGDIEYACYAAWYHSSYSFFVGEELKYVDKKYEQYMMDLMIKFKQKNQIYYTQIWRQLGFNLQGLAEDKLQLVGQAFNEDEMVPIIIEAKNVASLFSVYYSKLVLNYLFGNDERAVENAQLAEQYTTGICSLMMIPLHNFYYSLALLARYPKVEPSERKKYLNWVEANQKKMKNWAHNAPMNYQHKYDLVEAEKARVLGRKNKAIDYYDRAIAGAKENEYINEEALANELAAKFYFSWEKERIASGYLADAYYAYARWGAGAKVEDLEQCYPQILPPIFNQPMSFKTSETIAQMTVGTVSVNGSGNAAVLDLATVLKASQAISGEIQIEQLLSTLMQVAIENAGAEKGSLILLEKDKLAIAAQYVSGMGCTLPSTLVANNCAIPLTLINYVWRTSQTLVINDATAETTFAADGYIIQSKPKSVLCTPIVNGGKLIGILYLENNCTTGAFTPDRLEVLRILSSQAAISIENAFLYRTLEQKVEERTAQLAEANTDLEKKNALIRHIFGRYLTDEVVATLLEKPEGLKMGGERRKITILTSDLRGFTATSEKLSPEEVVKILNFYLEHMANVISQYRGTIDEFMGDGILVLFGAPTARVDDATRAVACAVAMQLAMSAVNEKMKEWELPPLQMGIGINTGEVVVGNIGSERRTKYGIVGSQVNLTYRIESYTTGGQIFISESTFQEVESLVRIDSKKLVEPKGVKQPLAIYEVGGIGGEYNLFLPKEEEVFFALPEAIPIQYKVLDEKHVGENVFEASLVKLSAKGAKVRWSKGESQELPVALCNIKMNFLTFNNGTEVSEDIYAKVVDKPGEKGGFYIHFTAKPLEIQAMLEALYKSISQNGDSLRDSSVSRLGVEV